MKDKSTKLERRRLLRLLALASVAIPAIAVATCTPGVKPGARRFPGGGAHGENNGHGRGSR